MKNKNIELIGWIGVVMIVGAFALNTLAISRPDSLIYLLLNFVGSVAIIISSLSKKDYQPATLNIIWAVIAVIGLLRALL